MSKAVLRIISVFFLASVEICCPGFCEMTAASGNKTDLMPQTAASKASTNASNEESVRKPGEVEELIDENHYTSYAPAPFLKGPAEAVAEPGSALSAAQIAKFEGKKVEIKTQYVRKSEVAGDTLKDGDIVTYTGILSLKKDAGDPKATTIILSDASGEVKTKLQATKPPSIADKLEGDGKLPDGEHIVEIRVIK